VQLTGSVIETGGSDGQSFNILIGPSSITWIRTGARFVPCMRSTELDNSPISLSSSAQNASTYTIPVLCGLTPFHTPGVPDQTFRFLSAIFLHGGVIHILLNMIVQWRVGIPLEKEHGPIRIAIIYLVSGVTGFILGGVLSPITLVSLGASGALFGLIACLLWELVYRWRDIVNPKRELAVLIVMIAVSFLIGLIPGVDNFSHIGGFSMGLLLGVALLDPGTTTVAGDVTHGYEGVWQHPTAATGKKPWPSRWWWWLVRAIALILAVVYFAVLYTEFKSGQSGVQVCSWCQYLSCVPAFGNCNAFTSGGGL